jgi:hypothetical protein
MSAACTRGTATDEIKGLLFDYQDYASSLEILCYEVGRGGMIGFPLAESKASLCEHSMAKSPAIFQEATKSKTRFASRAL